MLCLDLSVLAQVLGAICCTDTFLKCTCSIGADTEGMEDQEITGQMIWC